MSKSDEYVTRLLRERPTRTRSGIPITIENDGYSVRTWSGRSLNGSYSVYNPTDYPNLFGWNKEPTLDEKIDLIMNHLGLEFEYVPATLKIRKARKS